MSGLFGLFSSSAAAQPASSSTMDPHAQLEARVKDMEQIAQLLKLDDPEKFAASLPDVATLQKQYGINVDLAKIMKGLDKNLMQSIGLNKNEDVITYMAQQIPNSDAKTRLLTTLDAAGKDGVLVKDALLPYMRMRARHQYYMYKYMQLNVFVIMYTMKMQELFRATNESVLAAVANSQDKQAKVLSTLTDASKLLAALPEAEQQMQAAGFANIAGGVEKKLTDYMRELRAQLEKLKQDKMLDVIKDIWTDKQQAPAAAAASAFVPPQQGFGYQPAGFVPPQQGFGRPAFGQQQQFNPAQQFSRLG